MSKLNIPVAVATGALITLAVTAIVSSRTGKDPIKPEPPEQRTFAYSSQTEQSRCTFLPSDVMHESKPQSPYYRGGCLEHVTHFEMEDGKEPPLSLFIRKQGEASRFWSMNGYFGKQRALFHLTPYTPQVTGGPDDRVQLYDVRSETGENPCEGEPYEVTERERLNAPWLAQLEGKAMAIPGYWQNGEWHSGRKDGSASGFTLSCMSGVMAKCLLWGYASWDDPDGAMLERLHRACVQASRARYAKGRDGSYTCKNTEVDIWDQRGILKKGDNADLQFESLWNEDGLVCLARTRYQGCGDELREDGLLVGPAGVPLNGKPCSEPDGSPDSWRDGALIAISSSPANAVHAAGDPTPRCPSRRGAGCNP